MNNAFPALLCIALVAVVTGCDLTGSDTVRRTPEESLVGWWTFDEGRGTTAMDASGNGNVATIRNGAWGTGKLGHALEMNGGDDGIVEISLSEGLRSTQERITVMAWTYRSMRHNVAVLGHGYPYLFLGFHGPRFKWQVVNSEGQRASCYAGREHKAVLDRWLHLTGTYDGRTARLYVDGEEICSTSLRGSIAMPQVPFTLSGYVDEDGKIVDEITGRLDDVRIYAEALTEREIRDIVEATP